MYGFSVMDLSFVSHDISEFFIAADAFKTFSSFVQIKCFESVFVSFRRKNAADLINVSPAFTAPGDVKYYVYSHRQLCDYRIVWKV